MALPITLGALRGLLKELQVSSRDERPLVVGGPTELARLLVRELLAGNGSHAAIRTGDPEGGLLYLHAGDPDEAALKRARRARVPIIAVVDARWSGDIPFVLATDVVRIPVGEGFPVEEIARAIASRLGEEAAPLAGRLPVLRPAVRDWLVASFSRKNGILAAAVFVPGADLPILALNQLRLVLRLEQASGLDPDVRERAPEILAALGAGLGFRAVARELLDLLPVAGWARRRSLATPTRRERPGFAGALVQGAVAYAGTCALGEATIRRLPAEASRGVL